MRTRKVIASVTILVVAMMTAWPWIESWSLTGRFTPIRIIETLQNPVAVMKWTSDGLVLADGRTVQLPGLRGLPANSAALTAAIQRGVETDQEGRVWGIVRICHWCGNDPVREHEARVDLADMLTFLRIGDPITAIKEKDFLAREAGGKFSESGWNISEFLQFRAWQSVNCSPE